MNFESEFEQKFNMKLALLHKRALHKTSNILIVENVAKASLLVQFLCSNIQLHFITPTITSNCEEMTSNTENHDSSAAVPLFKCNAILHLGHFSNTTPLKADDRIEQKPRSRFLRSQAKRLNNMREKLNEGNTKSQLNPKDNDAILHRIQGNRSGKLGSPKCIFKKRRNNEAFESKLAFDLRNRVFESSFDVPDPIWRFDKNSLSKKNSNFIGTNKSTCNILLDDPSCVEYHAVLQFRAIFTKQPDKIRGKRILPFIMDLGSSNGTYLNNNKMQPHEYIQVKQGDVLKFGNSLKEYVLLSKNVDDINGTNDDCEPLCLALLSLNV